MWLFKTPRINSKYFSYYQLAHHFELAGLVTLAAALVLFLAGGKCWLAVISVAIFLLAISPLIQSWVALFKHECLRFRGEIPIGLVFDWILADNFIRGKTSFFIGCLYFFYAVGLFFLAWIFLTA